LAALGGVLRGLRDCSGSFGWRRFRRRLSPQERDGFEQFTAMTNTPYAEVLQVFCRQARQNRIVDVVLPEGGLVLFETEAPQPSAEVHDSVLIWLMPMITEVKQRV
jgi:hypothetical protein